mmetsp:Transcript_23089/g.64129  ORF Transcript_23089/g.64129 Transcript_23089/m.64129 type:complete len:212 (-) Transcript_23089:443-1078(-)
MPTFAEGHEKLIEFQAKHMKLVMLWKSSSVTLPDPSTRNRTQRSEAACGSSTTIGAVTSGKAAKFFGRSSPRPLRAIFSTEAPSSKAVGLIHGSASRSIICLAAYRIRQLPASSAARFTSLVGQPQRASKKARQRLSWSAMRRNFEHDWAKAQRSFIGRASTRAPSRSSSGSCRRLRYCALLFPSSGRCWLAGAEASGRLRAIATLPACAS